MIRELSIEEVPLAADIIRRAFATVAEEFGLTLENCPTHPTFLTEERLQGEMQRGLRLYMLQEGDNPVGVVGLRRLEDGSTALERLAVLPEHRHRGYGVQLVELICRQAAQAGSGKVSLQIIDEHTVLKDWYTRLGFIAIEVRQFRHLPFNVCFMEKAL
ncbi:MAG: GNAT family N-acetyltransferase [Armatimonadota bacterium]